MITLQDVKRRMRDPVPDPVQCRLDRDWLVGQLEDALADVVAFRRALKDVEMLVCESVDAARAAASLARMLRTNAVEVVQ